jgi:hypothetical protein
MHQRFSLLAYKTLRSQLKVKDLLTVFFLLVSGFALLLNPSDEGDIFLEHVG